MNQAAGKVIVIGGGVIGAFCAYFLNRAGREVTIIDQGRFGMGDFPSTSRSKRIWREAGEIDPFLLPGSFSFFLRSRRWGSLAHNGQGIAFPARQKAL